MVMGQGPFRQVMRQFIIEHHLQGRAYVKAPVPPPILLDYSSSADIGVALIQSADLSYYYSTPNKIFEYIMAGIPVIVSDFPEMRKIVSQFGVGLTVNPEDPRDIASKIKMLLEDEELYNRMARNARKAAREALNWEKEEKKLLEFYEQISG